jgi:hypothetical protein
VRRIIEPNCLRVLFYAFTQATSTRAAETQLARHGRAAIRTVVNILAARIARRLAIRVNFSLHGYILSFRRESDEAITFPRASLYASPFIQVASTLAAPLNFRKRPQHSIVLVAKLSCNTISAMDGEDSAALHAGTSPSRIKESTVTTSGSN